MATLDKTTTNRDVPASDESSTKRSESDVYDRQIRLWGADAQVRRMLGFKR